MLAVLFGIEGAEVLKFVEDGETDAFAVLIETPLQATSCPTCRADVVATDPVTQELPRPRQVPSICSSHGSDVSGSARTRHATRTSSQSRVTTSMRSSPGSRSANTLGGVILKPR